MPNWSYLAHRAGTGRWFRPMRAGLVAGALLLPGALGAQPAPPAPPAAPPPELNPFAAEEVTIPVLRPPGGARPGMKLELRQVEFDGLELVQMHLLGPNFDWQCEPFLEWGSVPTGAEESVALAYRPDQRARVSFALYRPRELLPDLSVASLTSYLALMRARDEKNFILLTPIEPDAPNLNGGSFSGFPVQSVSYAYKSGEHDYLLHTDYFFDLNQEWVMVVRFTAPRALHDHLAAGVRLRIGRSQAKRGLGVRAPAAEGGEEKVVTPEEAAAAAPSAGPAPAAPAPAGAAP